MLMKFSKLFSRQVVASSVLGLSLVFSNVASASVELGAARSGGVAAFGPFSESVSGPLRSVLERCLVRPYGHRANGGQVLGDYESTCSALVRDGRSALVAFDESGTLDLAWELKLIGSDYSDGGDLWDVAVWDEQFHLVLEAQRVLAFGDPFEALVQLTDAHPSAQRHDPALDE